VTTTEVSEMSEKLVGGTDEDRKEILKLHEE
jgi:hypothetical protein